MLNKFFSFCLIFFTKVVPIEFLESRWVPAAAAKSLQSCLTLCDPIDGSPPGSPIPGILQARTLEWVAISFSNAWKWSRSVVSNPQLPHGLQPTRLLHPWDFPGKSTWLGCHCLLRGGYLISAISFIQKSNLTGPSFFYWTSIYWMLTLWQALRIHNCA